MEVFNAGKKYNVIYAYPPWSFKTYLEKGKDRSAERHYPTMKKEDIQALPIEKIASENSVLLLWVTAPCLLEGIELISA